MPDGSADAAEPGWRPLTGRIGAEAVGIDLREPVDDERLGFILDGLGALGSDGLEAAGDALIEHLTMLSPGASFGRRTLSR